VQEGGHLLAETGQVRGVQRRLDHRPAVPVVPAACHRASGARPRSLRARGEPSGPGPAPRPRGSAHRVGPGTMRRVDPELEKRVAAAAAADLVEDGMRVGLGTGTTVNALLPLIAARGLRLVCVATSPRTERVAL